MCEMTDNCKHDVVKVRVGNEDESKTHMTAPPSKLVKLPFAHLYRMINDRPIS